MRGVSALGDVLARFPSADVRVFMVWIAAVETDRGPPSSDVRAPLRDPRVTEWWDPARWLSPRVIAERVERARRSGESPPATDDPAFDFIARYEAGVRWSDPFPTPGWSDEPVVTARDVLAQQLGSR